MLRYRMIGTQDGGTVCETNAEGQEVLRHPLLNKGTAFPPAERIAFGIDGYLPPAVSTLDLQLSRCHEAYGAKPTDLERHIYLRSLQDRNEVLFYALLGRHLEEMMRIVYTPTVGEACQKFSHIYRFPRGVFLSPENIHRVDEIFAGLPCRDVEVIVATDSAGILGIGDQGVGGMGIPIGKLSLYTAGAGINPAHCLPVTLDVGTDNQQLLEDPHYLGIRRPRMRGAEYFDLVDRFVQAVKRHFPLCLLQWEDFSKENAWSLLEKYRGELLSFNDDIQGTGAVVLSGIVCAVRAAGARLSDQVFVLYGSGAAGIGVAAQIRTALVGEGLTAAAAAARIHVLDSRGLLVEGRARIEDYKRPFTHPRAAVPWATVGERAPGLLEVVEKTRATVLLGLSGQPGSFSEEIVRAMAANCPRPLIFPLSNPTSLAEALPEDIYRWSGGRAVVATGSPFPDVEIGGERFTIGQGNNAFIFPGVGLGAVAVRSRAVSDEMFTAAAVRLAELVPVERIARRCVFPAIGALREVSREIALVVARTAVAQGLAQDAQAAADVPAAIDRRVWRPAYPRLVHRAATS
ncbi:MAG TPA: NAD-dependent malic enzyme [Candidatus Methanoperedens sp.]|nr:NAD-dependent malic enzyme [Candidatus Methanoperedens sp.]